MQFDCLDTRGEIKGQRLFSAGSEIERETGRLAAPVRGQFLSTSYKFHTYLSMESKRDFFVFLQQILFGSPSSSCSSTPRRPGSPERDINGNTGDPLDFLNRTRTTSEQSEVDDKVMPLPNIRGRARKWKSCSSMQSPYQQQQQQQQQQHQQQQQQLSRRSGGGGALGPLNAEIKTYSAKSLSDEERRRRALLLLKRQSSDPIYGYMYLRRSNRGAAEKSGNGGSGSLSSSPAITSSSSSSSSSSATSPCGSPPGGLFANGARHRNLIAERIAQLVNLCVQLNIIKMRDST